MTMTPARAAWSFGSRKPGEHGHQGKEALPWWSFALLGGLVSAWLLISVLGARLGLPAGDAHGDSTPGSILESVKMWGLYLAAFLPGAIGGGVLGWFIIRRVNSILGKFFSSFNRFFDWTTAAYGKTVGWTLRLSAIVLFIYVGLIGLTAFGFTRVPSGFVPVQDKGYLLINMQLPDAASLERTVEVAERAGRIARETPGVAHTATYAGQSVLLNSFTSNYGTMFVVFHPFHERRGHALSGEAIMNTLRARFQREIPEARLLVFGAPAVRVWAMPVDSN
jgi:multidrug efflux pump